MAEFLWNENKLMRMNENYYDDYHKWLRWAYERRYARGSCSKGAGKKAGFQEYRDPFKAYWKDELSVGILKRESKFIGIACLVAKEVVDEERFVRMLGLSFEKNVQWKAGLCLVARHFIKRQPRDKKRKI